MDQKTEKKDELNLTSPKSGEQLTQPFLVELKKITDSNRPISGISSGFIGIDQITKGFHPGELIVVGGRPGSGKTTFVLNIAEFVAFRAELPVALFSLEMTTNQVMKRLISSNQQIELDKLRSKGVSSNEIKKIKKATENFEKTKTLYVDDSHYLTLKILREKIYKWLNSVGGFGLIIIDYINLMMSEGTAENRYQEMANISRSLKLLAKELNCPIIVVSQVSRFLEQRPDKRPILSDLRDSGTLEEDADVVICLYREILYWDDPDDPNCERKAEALIRKNRFGKKGTVYLSFFGEYSQFRNSATI